MDILKIPTSIFETTTKQCFSIKLNNHLIQLLIHLAR